jgi:hypothetical protein
LNHDGVWAQDGATGDSFLAKMALQVELVRKGMMTARGLLGTKNVATQS